MYLLGDIGPIVVAAAVVGEGEGDGDGDGDGDGGGCGGDQVAVVGGLAEEAESDQLPKELAGDEHG